jgi:hypothetical protein
MVQREMERLEQLNEEKEYYTQQNKIFRHFQNYQQIGRITAQIDSSFLNKKPV